MSLRIRRQGAAIVAKKR